MMKKFLLIPLFTLLLLSTSNAAEQAPAPAAYVATQHYSGLYKAERVYVFNRYEETWYGDSQFNKVSTIYCLDARSTLNNKGLWVGNLDDKGGCANPAEAPSRATGNYLNYLMEIAAAKRQSAQ